MEKAFNNEHKTAISDLLTNYYNNDKYLDVVFICKDNTCVSVHKVILISVSEYVKQIIHNSSSEMIFISLPDFDSSFVEIFVNFLYEGVTKVKLLELSHLKELLTVLGVQLANCEIQQCASVSKKIIVEDVDNQKTVLNDIAEDVESAWCSQQSDDTNLLDPADNSAIPEPDYPFSNDEISQAVDNPENFQSVVSDEKRSFSNVLDIKKEKDKVNCLSLENIFSLEENRSKYTENENLSDVVSGIGRSSATCINSVPAIDSFVNVVIQREPGEPIWKDGSSVIAMSKSLPVSNNKNDDNEDVIEVTDDGHENNYLMEQSSVVNEDILSNSNSHQSGTDLKNTYKSFIQDHNLLKKTSCSKSDLQNEKQCSRGEVKKAHKWIYCKYCKNKFQSTPNFAFHRCDLYRSTKAAYQKDISSFTITDESHSSGNSEIFQYDTEECDTSNQEIEIDIKCLSSEKVYVDTFQVPKNVSFEHNNTSDIVSDPDNMLINYDTINTAESHNSEQANLEDGSCVTSIPNAVNGSDVMIVSDDVQNKNLMRQNITSQNPILLSLLRNSESSETAVSNDTVPAGEDLVNDITLFEPEKQSQENNTCVSSMSETLQVSNIHKNDDGDDDIIPISDDEQESNLMEQRNLDNENIPFNANSLQSQAVSNNSSEYVIKERQKLRQKEYINERQKSILEEVYKKNKYLNDKLRDELVKSLQISRYRLTKWFGQKRYRDQLAQVSSSIQKNETKNGHFSKEQKIKLKQVSNKTKYLTEEQAKDVVNSLGTKIDAVQKWFAGQRSKDITLIPSNTSVEGSCTSIDEPQFVDSSADDSDKISSTSNDMWDKVHTNFPFSQYIRDTLQRNESSSDVVTGNMNGIVLSDLISIESDEEDDTKNSLVIYDSVSDTNDIPDSCVSAQENLNIQNDTFNQRSLTSKQRLQLKDVYSKTKYVTEEQAETLAYSFGVSKSTLKKWFSRQRYMDMRRVKVSLLLADKGNPKHEAVRRYYKCNMCEKKFTRSCTMKEHVAAAHNNVRYACSYCNQLFTNRGSRSAHIKAIHMNIKDYMCEVCHKCFRHPHVLRKHMIFQHSKTRN